MAIFIKKIKALIKKSQRLEYIVKLLQFRLHHYLAKFISDERFLKVQYLVRTGNRLNLREPKSYNEKVQWLKLYYKNPLLRRCVDKWEVREFIAEKGLSRILIPAVGPFESMSEIDTTSLPDEFILKLTNGSGFNIICQGKSAFDFESAQRKFSMWTDIDFFSARREWAYKGVKNRIMCEELLVNDDGGLPSDIRFFCFDGEPQFVAVDLDSVVDGVKTSNYYRHLFTPDWNPIDGLIEYPKKPGLNIDKPEMLADMISISRILSSDFPAVRVDLYTTGNQVFFGELTFYHASGYQRFSPPEFGLTVGSYLKLPSSSEEAKT